MNRAVFFTEVRKAKLFGSVISNPQVIGTEAIIGAFENAGLSDPRWLAYMLATVLHETARTMRPIEEYGKGAGHSYGDAVGPYRQRYYGRGYVQLTWEANYKKAQDKLGLPFLSQPQLALDPKNAADIMISGMTEGWFTTKKLSDYINDNGTDYVNARRIINGLDKASTIAGYAAKFEAAIRSAGDITPGFPPPPDIAAPKPANPPETETEEAPSLVDACMKLISALIGLFGKKTS
jgi:putative chitinase